MMRSRPCVRAPLCGAVVLVALAAGLPPVALADARVPPYSRGAYYPYGYGYDSCFRYGRCTADEVQRLREHIQRADRVAPQVPEARARPPTLPRGDVTPTPEDQIQPAYRDASRLREEYGGASSSRP